MPLGTIDRTPPPFFRQGPSAISKLLLCGALAVFLMVADARFKVMQPVRVALAYVLYPARWAVLQPVQWGRGVGRHFQQLTDAQADAEQARQRLGEQALRSNQVEQLMLENARLRALLDLRTRVSTPSVMAQVLYEAADPYSRRIVIDRGSLAEVQPGSPVIDDTGVLGQVTRVYPDYSEVTLLTDRDQAIPVLNTRTGLRGVAFGDPSGRGNGLELRYMAANADVQVGDVLSTSGLDGVYPAGLRVARVAEVERRAETSFARVQLAPLGRPAGAVHVMVLRPLSAQIPAAPPLPAEASGATPVARKKAGR